MAEQITLTTPIVKPQETTSEYKIIHICFYVEQKRLILAIRGTQGQIIEASREGQVAVDLMRILNKANNSVKSMEKRALEWIQSQPEGSLLAGSITGLPD